MTTVSQNLIFAIYVKKAKKNFWRLNENTNHTKH